MGFSDGILSFTVWPTHAGAVNERGEELMGHPDYDRGQIHWNLNEQGTLVGHVHIKVPPGHLDWTHIIYTHHPTNPGCVTAQKLAQPLRLPDGRRHRPDRHHRRGRSSPQPRQGAS